MCHNSMYWSIDGLLMKAFGVKSTVTPFAYWCRSSGKTFPIPLNKSTGSTLWLSSAETVRISVANRWKREFSVTNHQVSFKKVYLVGEMAGNFVACIHIIDARLCLVSKQSQRTLVHIEDIFPCETSHGASPWGPSTSTTKVCVEWVCKAMRFIDRDLLPPFRSL